MTGSELGGADPWYYKLTKENHFLPDVTAIPEEVARKARACSSALPANPVGSIGTPELYAQLVDFCRKYDILLVHDNAYSDIIFDGAHGGSIFNTPGAEECAVEFFSLSKSFNMTGARISFLVGRPDVIAACKKLRTQIDFGMFLPIQKDCHCCLDRPAGRRTTPVRRVSAPAATLCAAACAASAGTYPTATAACLCGLHCPPATPTAWPSAWS